MVILQRYRITDLYTNAPQGWYYYAKVGRERMHSEGEEQTLIEDHLIDRGSISGLSLLTSLVSLPTCQGS